MANQYVLTGTIIETGETEELGSAYDIFYLVRLADTAKTLNRWTDLRISMPDNTGE